MSGSSGVGGGGVQQGGGYGSSSWGDKRSSGKGKGKGSSSSGSVTPDGLVEGGDLATNRAIQRRQQGDTGGGLGGGQQEGAVMADKVRQAGKADADLKKIRDGFQQRYSGASKSGRGAPGSRIVAIDGPDANLVATAVLRHDTRPTFHSPGEELSLTGEGSGSLNSQADIAGLPGMAGDSFVADDDTGNENVTGTHSEVVIHEKIHESDGKTIDFTGFIGAGALSAMASSGMQKAAMSNYIQQQEIQKTAQGEMSSLGVATTDVSQGQLTSTLHSVSIQQSEEKFDHIFHAVMLVVSIALLVIPGIGELADAGLMAADAGADAGAAGADAGSSVGSAAGGSGDVGGIGSSSGGGSGGDIEMSDFSGRSSSTNTGSTGDTGDTGSDAVRKQEGEQQASKARDEVERSSSEGSGNSGEPSSVQEQNIDNAEDDMEEDAKKVEEDAKKENEEKIKGDRDKSEDKKTSRTRKAVKYARRTMVAAQVGEQVYSSTQDEKQAQIKEQIATYKQAQQVTAATMEGVLPNIIKTSNKNLDQGLQAANELVTGAIRVINTEIPSNIRFYSA